MSLLTQNVWDMTGAGGLGQMVRDCNTALVEGPLVAEIRVKEIVIEIWNAFADALGKWVPEDGEKEFGQADLAELMMVLEARLSGFVAQRQDITALVEIGAQRAQSEMLGLGIGIGYTGSWLGGIDFDYERNTATGLAVRSRFQYHAQSMAPDGARWVAIRDEMAESTPPSLNEVLGQALTELLLNKDDSDILNKIPWAPKEAEGTA